MSRLPPASFFDGSIPVVLVVGGAGFLGSFLCERLLLRNLKVICFDNWGTGLRENVAHMVSDSHFFLLEGDANVSLPRELLRVNYVIDLAGLDSYADGEDLSIETLTSNSVGVKNLLDFSLLHSARFVLGSTVASLSPTSSGGATLSDYFGRDRAQEGLFSHHEAKRFAEAVTVEYGVKKALDVRIVRFGNLYGPRMPLFTGGVIARILKEYLQRGLILASPLLSEAILYPIYVQDAVEALEKVIFSSGIRNEIVAVSGEEMRGEEVLRTFASLRPDARVELVQGVFFPSEPVLAKEAVYLGRGFLSWQPKTDLRQGVEKTLEWFSRNRMSFADLKSGRLETPVRRGESAGRKARRWVRLLKPDFGKSIGLLRSLAVGTLVFLLWLFGLPLFSFYLGSFSLKQSRAGLENGETVRAAEWASASSFWFGMSARAFSHWFVLPGLKNEAASFSSDAAFLGRTAQILTKAANFVHGSAVLIDGILNGESKVSKEQAHALAVDARLIQERLAFLETETTGGEDVSSIRSFRQGFLVAASFLDNVGPLTGEEGVRKYMVVFVDNTRARPGGGVIDGFALASFQDGHLLKLEFKDASYADSKLGGVVLPPAPLGLYGGLETWWLKDAMWEPVFSDVARRIVWFANVELGEEVDGVVALDAEAFSRFLGQDRPLSVGDIPIGPAEFRQQVEQDASSIMREVAQKLFSRFQENAEDRIFQFARVLGEAIEEKHAAVWVGDSRVSNVLSESSWDGSSPVGCKVEIKNCFLDYVSVREASIEGVSSRAVRSYSLDVEPVGGRLGHRMVVSLENKDLRQAYKTYLKVLMVDSSSRVNVGSSGEDYVILTPDITLEGGRRGAGVYVELSPGESRQLIFSWDTPSFVGTRGEYVLDWDKPFGSTADNLWFNFQFLGKQLQAFPSPSLTSEGMVGYNVKLLQDLGFNIIWQNQ